MFKTLSTQYTFLKNISTHTCAFVASIFGDPSPPITPNQACFIAAFSTRLDTLIIQFEVPKQLIDTCMEGLTHVDTVILPSDSELPKEKHQIISFAILKAETFAVRNFDAHFSTKSAELLYQIFGLEGEVKHLVVRLSKRRRSLTSIRNICTLAKASGPQAAITAIQDKVSKLQENGDSFIEMDNPPSGSAESLRMHFIRREAALMQEINELQQQLTAQIYRTEAAEGLNEAQTQTILALRQEVAALKAAMPASAALVEVVLPPDLPKAMTRQEILEAFSTNGPSKFFQLVTRPGVTVRDEDLVSVFSNTRQTSVVSYFRSLCKLNDPDFRFAKLFYRACSPSFSPALIRACIPAEYLGIATCFFEGASAPRAADLCLAIHFGTAGLVAACLRQFPSASLAQHLQTPLPAFWRDNPADIATTPLEFLNPVAQNVLFALALRLESQSPDDPGWREVIEITRNSIRTSGVEIQTLFIPHLPQHSPRQAPIMLATLLCGAELTDLAFDYLKNPGDIPKIPFPPLYNLGNLFYVALTSSTPFTDETLGLLLRHGGISGDSAAFRKDLQILCQQLNAIKVQTREYRRAWVSTEGIAFSPKQTYDLVRYNLFAQDPSLGLFQDSVKRFTDFLTEILWDNLNPKTPALPYIIPFIHQVSGVAQRVDERNGWRTHTFSDMLQIFANSYRFNENNDLPLMLYFGLSDFAPKNLFASTPASTRPIVNALRALHS